VRGVALNYDPDPAIKLKLQQCKSYDLMKSALIAPAPHQISISLPLSWSEVVELHV